MGSFGPRTPSREKAIEQRIKRARRMADARALATHTEAEWSALVSFCGGRCVRCGAHGRIEKDHILLVARGGSDGIDNLQPLCGRCNSGKSLDVTDHRPTGWREAVREATQ